MVDIDFFMHETSAHIVTGEDSLTWDLIGTGEVRDAKICLSCSN